MSDTTTDERGARTLDDLEADLRVERDTNVLLSDANAKLLHYVEELKLQERQCLQKQTDAELRRQHSELAHYKLHTLWQTREASLLEEMAQRGVELARLNNRLRVLAHIEQLATHNGGQLPGGVQQLYNSMRCGVCGKASPHLFQARPDCPHVVVCTVLARRWPLCALSAASVDSPVQDLSRAQQRHTR